MSSNPYEEEAEAFAIQITEEEERVTDELFEHPTRDDLHEQRERGQEYEAVIHIHFHAAWRR